MAPTVEATPATKSEVKPEVKPGAQHQVISVAPVPVVVGDTLGANMKKITDDAYHTFMNIIIPHIFDKHPHITPTQLMRRVIDSWELIIGQRDDELAELLLRKGVLRSWCIRFTHGICVANRTEQRYSQFTTDLIAKLKTDMPGRTETEYWFFVVQDWEKLQTGKKLTENNEYVLDPRDISLDEDTCENKAVKKDDIPESKAPVNENNEIITKEHFIKFIETIVSNMPITMNEYEKLQQKLHTIHAYANLDLSPDAYSKAMTQIRNYYGTRVITIYDIYEACKMVSV